MDISYNKIDLQYFMNPAFSSIMDKKTPVDEELKLNFKMYKKRIFLLTKEFLNDNPTHDLRLNSLFNIYATTCIEYFKFNDKRNDIQKDYEDLVLNPVDPSCNTINQDPNNYIMKKSTTHVPKITDHIDIKSTKTKKKIIIPKIRHVKNKNMKFKKNINKK